MFHKLLAAGLAAATLSAGFIALSPAFASNATPSSIGPSQGFSQVLGSKQAVGFFTSQAGQCNVTLMVSEAFNDFTTTVPSSAVRFTVKLKPAQSTELASAEDRSLSVTCGSEAKTVEISVTPQTLM